MSEPKDVYGESRQALDGMGRVGHITIAPAVERVKACPECGSPDVIGLVSADVECLTCGTTSMGHLRSRPEVAARRKAAYLTAQADAFDS